MSSLLVVEHLDGVDQLHLGLAAIVEVLAEFIPHGREPTLHLIL